eukprot:Gb_19692 [translate_table: standard]
MVRSVGNLKYYEWGFLFRWQESKTAMMGTGCGKKNCGFVVLTRNHKEKEYSSPPRQTDIIVGEMILCTATLFAPNIEEKWAVLIQIFGDGHSWPATEVKCWDPAFPMSRFSQPMPSYLANGRNLGILDKQGNGCVSEELIFSQEQPINHNPPIIGQHRDSDDMAPNMDSRVCDSLFNKWVRDCVMMPEGLRYEGKLLNCYFGHKNQTINEIATRDSDDTAPHYAFQHGSFFVGQKKKCEVELSSGDLRPASIDFILLRLSLLPFAFLFLFFFPKENKGKFHQDATCNGFTLHIRGNLAVSTPVLPILALTVCTTIRGKAWKPAFATELLLLRGIFIPVHLSHDVLTCFLVATILVPIVATPRGSKRGSSMGKYMRKGKGTTGEVAVMEVPQGSMGVRTRARTRTLALQRHCKVSPAKSSKICIEPLQTTSYLQLRSRRLEKVSVCCPQEPKSLEKPSLDCSISEGKNLREKHEEELKFTVSEELKSKSQQSISAGHRSIRRARRVPSEAGYSGTNSTSFSQGCSKVKSGRTQRKEVKRATHIETQDIIPQTSTRVQAGQSQGFQDETPVEASFGENVIDHEGRDRHIRETTPCNLTGDGETLESPGSTTRPSRRSSGRRRIQNEGRRNAPTSREMEEFFSGAEQQQQRTFIERYNYDPVNDLPLSGRYEWLRL